MLKFKRKRETTDGMTNEVQFVSGHFEATI